MDSYKVAKGDTLGKLAKRFNVPVNALVAANKITHPKLWIFENDTIKIPKPGDTNSTEDPAPEPEAPPPPPPPPPPAPIPPKGKEVYWKSEYDKLMAEGKLPDDSVVLPDPPPPPPPAPEPTFVPEEDTGGTPELTWQEKISKAISDASNEPRKSFVDSVEKIGDKAGVPMAGRLARDLLGLGETGLMLLGGPRSPTFPKVPELPKKFSGPYSEPVAPSNYGPETVARQAERLPDPAGRVEPWFGSFDPKVAGAKGPEAFLPPKSNPLWDLFGSKPAPDLKGPQNPNVTTPTVQPELGGLPSRFGAPHEALPEPQVQAFKPGQWINRTETTIDPKFARIPKVKVQSQADKDIAAMWKRHDTAIKKSNNVKNIDHDMVAKVLKMMQMKGGF